MPLWAHDFGFLVAIVAHQLAEILKAQTHGDLVASCGGNKVIQPLEIYRGLCKRFYYVKPLYVSAYISIL